MQTPGEEDGFTESLLSTEKSKNPRHEENGGVTQPQRRTQRLSGEKHWERDFNGSGPNIYIGKLLVTPSNPCFKDGG